MASFNEIVSETLGIEGDWSDHPSDSGGKTMFGITEGVAREYGYTGPMKDLPVHLAKQIYRERYWNVMRLDEVLSIAPAIVGELFDTGVNQGTGRAGEYLQLALNALNRQQKDYDDIKVDGDIGPGTLHALNIYRTKRDRRGDVVMLRALNCLQGSFYITLSQRREKDEDFVFGWLFNRVVV